MLEGLDQIDWSRLHHAYGTAEDVPALLRALMSGDQAQREEAAYELFGNIWHQGTIYEATVHAVPFLIEMLQSPDLPDPALVALLLGSIASGCGYFEVHAQLILDKADKALWKKILRKRGTTLEAELERERAITQTVRAQMLNALPLLVPFLSHPELRLTLAEAFGAFPDQRDTYLPWLEQALARETDEEAKAALEESVRRLRNA